MAQGVLCLAHTAQPQPLRVLDVSKVIKVGANSMEMLVEMIEEGLDALEAVILESLIGQCDASAGKAPCMH